MKEKNKKIVLISLCIIIILLLALAYIEINKSNYKNSIKQYEILISKNNYTEALDLLLKLKKKNNNDDLEEKIKTTTQLKNDKQYLEKGKLLIEKSEYNEAIGTLKNVSKTNKSLFEEAQTIINTSLSNIIDKYLEKTLELIDNKDFVEAHRYINEILVLQPKNKDALAFKERISIELARMKVEEYMTNNTIALYEEFNTKIVDREYYIFLEQDKHTSQVSDIRYCVDKETDQVFIQISTGELLTYEDYQVLLEAYAKTEDEQEQQENENNTEEIVNRNIQQIGSLIITLREIEYSSQYNMSKVDYKVTTEVGSSTMSGGNWFMDFYDENDNLMASVPCGNNCVAPGKYGYYDRIAPNIDLRNYKYFKIKGTELIDYPVPEEIWSN